jgi:hypothetical protein
MSDAYFVTSPQGNRITLPGAITVIGFAFRCVLDITD